MRLRRLTVAFFLWTAIVPWGTHPSLAVEPCRRFVFTAGRNLQEVWGHEIDAASGRLDPVPGAPYSIPARPTEVAVHPAGRYVYVAGEDSFRLFGYSLEPRTGALSPIPGSPFDAVGEAAGLAIHPNGRFLYMADPLFEVVRRYRVERDGTLVRVPPSTGVANNVFAVAADPLGRFLYATTLSEGLSDYTGRVWAFAVDATTGSLTPVPGSPYLEGPGKGTEFVVVDAFGQYLYATNREANEVTAYAIGANGTLTRVPGSPFPTGGLLPQRLVLSAKDRLYVSNTHSGTISAFAVNRADGSLTPLPGSPFPGPANPQGVVLDASERFAYVADSATNDIWGYRVQEDGSLAVLPDSPYVGGGRGWGVAATKDIDFGRLGPHCLEPVEGGGKGLK
jgi:6-phosphogluconolactonase